MRAAQALEAREPSQHMEHPGAEGDLARAADVVLALEGDQIGREMQLHAQIAFEDFGELALERAVRIEPRHLEFVLGRHQLEQAARHRLGQLFRPRNALFLETRDGVDARAIARGVRGVLIIGEEGDAALDRFVQRARDVARGIALAQ